MSPIIGPTSFPPYKILQDVGIFLRNAILTDGAICILFKQKQNFFS